VCAGCAVCGEVLHGADRGVCDRAGDRGLLQAGHYGGDGLDTFAVGCVVEQLQGDDRTADDLCGRGRSLPFGRNRGVVGSCPGGCVGNPGAVVPGQRHARSRTVRRLSRSSSEVPSATLIRKLRARRAASAVLFSLREAMISTIGSSASSGSSSSSLWAFSRVVMPRILARRHRAPGPNPTTCSPGSAR
jgi:hypothetical protein